MKRRSFLRIATGAAAFSFAPVARAQGAPWTRRDIANLSVDSPDVRALIAGVASLRQSGQWASIARIHNQGCAHANRLFLPWHRPYLGYMEFLIQGLSGNSNFAMPYWNWTNNPRLPAIFFDPLSSLYDSTRAVALGNTIPGGSVDPLTLRLVMGERDTGRFMGPTSRDQWDRQGFGVLEATPHNNVHNWISGDMATLFSPQDPIFWLHHANIDRLWKVWGGANPADDAWTGYSLQYGGVFPSWTVRDTVITERMGYRYDWEGGV